MEPLWFIDLLIDATGLLLWLNWRAIPLAQPTVGTGISLLATLHRTENRKVNRFGSLGVLVAILFLRGLFYWSLGRGLGWTLKLDLGPLVLPFRADFLGLTMLYSFGSYLLMWTALYNSLLFLSVVNARLGDSEYYQRLIRLHLGWVDVFPVWLKILLPFSFAVGLWLATSSLWIYLRMIPPNRYPEMVWQQAVVLGGISVLSIQYVVVICLALYMVQSYVFLGNNSFWSYVNATGRLLVRPFGAMPVQLWRIDLRPILATVIVLTAVFFARRGLILAYQRIPW